MLTKILKILFLAQEKDLHRLVLHYAYWAKSEGSQADQHDYHSIFQCNTSNCRHILFDK